MTPVYTLKFISHHYCHPENQEFLLVAAVVVMVVVVVVGGGEAGGGGAYMHQIKMTTALTDCIQTNLSRIWVVAVVGSWCWVGYM